jgi:hypothetical protein
MNDPHVEALRYRVKHLDSTDYDSAPPLEHHDHDFAVRIEKGEARVVMKSHHTTADSARAVVEPFLRAWELEAALFDPKDNFEFEFQNAEIIDRKPNSGGVGVEVRMVVRSAVSVSAHVKRGKYPGPPIKIACDLPTESILNAYRAYHAGRRSLSDAAYFSLTVLEGASGNRRQAARQFGIDASVLSNIGRLTAEKGGREARKSSGAFVSFTTEERAWLEAALKVIVRRAAKVAYDPHANKIMIGMGDLPTFS